MTTQVANNKEGNEVPNKVFGLLNAYRDKEELEKEKVLDPNKIEPSALDRMPTPTGWRILVLPYMGPSKSKGGLYLPDEAVERTQLTTVVGYVLKVGDLAYADKDKFPEGPWCKPKDWVIFGRSAGSRFKIEGGEVRILNDDEIIAKIKNPEDIIHVY